MSLNRYELTFNRLLYIKGVSRVSPTHTRSLGVPQLFDPLCNKLIDLNNKQVLVVHCEQHDQPALICSWIDQSIECDSSFSQATTRGLCRNCFASLVTLPSIATTTTTTTASILTTTYSPWQSGKVRSNEEVNLESHESIWEGHRLRLDSDRHDQSATTTTTEIIITDLNSQQRQ